MKSLDKSVMMVLVKDQKDKHNKFRHFLRAQVYDYDIKVFCTDLFLKSVKLKMNLKDSYPSSILMGCMMQQIRMSNPGIELEAPLFSTYTPVDVAMSELDYIED